MLAEIIQRKRLLIVDDDPAVLDALSFALEDTYDIQTAREGSQVFVVLHGLQPDLILLDLKMSGLDGIQILEVIRRTHPTLPVVIHTGWSTKEWAERAADLGVSAYMKKPCDIDQLLTRLTEVLHRTPPAFPSPSVSLPLPEGSFRPLVRRALAYLHQHFSRKLTLPELAAALDVTPFHLCRTFKLEVGRTPMTYLYEIRIEWAKVLLRSGACPVSIIAYQLGFAYPHHFSRVFKACTGCTPAQFRERAPASAILC